MKKILQWNGLEDEEMLIENQRTFSNTDKIIANLKTQLKEQQRIDQFFSNAKQQVDSSSTDKNLLKSDLEAEIRKQRAKYKKLEEIKSAHEVVHGQYVE